MVLGVVETGDAHAAPLFAGVARRGGGYQEEIADTNSSFSRFTWQIYRINFTLLISHWIPVLLVDEAVYLRPDLLDRGRDLLAVDVDVYPAGAASCHKLMLWQRWHKCPARYGTVRENAVVSFDCVFVFPNTATTIEVVTSTPVQNLNG